MFSCRDGNVNYNTIHHIHGTGAASSNAYGISATANAVSDTAFMCNHINISGNHIYDIPTWEALDTHGGRNITFRHNWIENCHYSILAGLYNLSGVLAVPQNIIVDDNIINSEPFVFGHEGYGIIMASTDTTLGISSATIVNNTMYGAGIELANAHAVIVSANKIFRSANGAGIYCVGSNTGINITNNYFEDVYSSFSGNTAAILVAFNDSIQGYIGANTLKRTNFVNPYGFAVNEYGIYMYTAGSSVVFAENDFSGASTQPNRYAGVIQQPFRMQGTGAPTGLIQAPVGSQFTRTDGSSATTLYLKEGLLISEWAALSSPLNFLVGSGLSGGFIPYYSATNTFSNSSVQISTGGNGITINSASIGRSGSGYAWIGNNVVYTDTTNNYRYRFTDFSSGWDFTAGSITANIAPSGTQGNAITFTTPFTIRTSTGNVGIGTLAPTSSLQIVGSFSRAYISKATSYTATISDDVIEVTATGQTITLPTAVGIQGRIYTIKLTASGSCTISTTSSQTIDGSTTYTLSAQYKYVTIESNNAGWNIIGNN